ncbi:MAG: shikimate dehydrogenase [Peptococcaceae bacterium]|nr:shikimate dehydrogenase [Peptococcaceae bacterium]
MGEINGKTRVCGIFGHPVGHSFSPAMHNAAFDHLGMNWVYVPFPVRPPGLPAAVEAVRALDLAGVNVTVPHKEAAAGLMDRLSPAARLSGAVNTIVNDGGVLTGHNTDGEGFVRALEEEAGIGAATGPALILGAGGAARSVALALALSGSPEVIVANRSGDRAAGLCELIKSTGCAASVLNWPGLPERGDGDCRDWAAVLGRARLVVQTTPLGMHPREGEVPPFPFNLLNAGHVVVDLIYNPARTGFMERCRAAGARVFNGTGMLLHQGAMAFELWTGKTPPLEVMRSALERCLEVRRQKETGDRRQEEVRE